MTRRGDTRGCAPGIHIKRAYDPPTGADGYRVLVDRLWPRGVAKGELKLGAWHKELAPSNALRSWFAHDPARWREFMNRYQEELRSTADASALLDELVKRASAATVTLVYGARDKEHNNAAVLRDELKRRLRASMREPPSRKREDR